jgi:hypothetical protein
MRKYPQVVVLQECAGRRPFVRKCSRCGEPFIKNNTIVVVETRVNIFRGDDGVEAFHPDCFSPKERK